MLSEFCELIREQDFAGLPSDPAAGVYSGYIPEEAPLPAVRCRRVGHDPLQTLDANDPDDLQFTDVEITVLAERMAEVDPIFDALLSWLRNYVGALSAGGSRNVVGVVIREDLEDVEEPPVDGSDVWRVGSQFTAQIQHKPAA